jgi:hypothetical protein
MPSDHDIRAVVVRVSTGERMSSPWYEYSKLRHFIRHGRCMHYCSSSDWSSPNGITSVSRLSKLHYNGFE